MKLLGKRWKYISEGNLHIVLQILETDYVVRLIKENDKSVECTSVQNSVQFVNLVMIPLLNTKLHSNVEIVCIPTEELTELTRVLYDIRPENRRIKSIISSYAIKAPNLTIVSSKCTTNYCLEIKPKEGFIAHSLKTYSKCFYCLKQYLKLKNGQINSTSYYCPLDLFSGDKGRMKCALSSLFINPQNNLKLFKDGILIYSEKFLNSSLDKIISDFQIFNDTDMFLECVIEMLLGDTHKTTTVEQDMDNLKKTGVCIENINLSKNSILYNILKLQKLADSISFDTTDTEDTNEHFLTILDDLNRMNLDLHKEIDRETFLELSNPEHLAIISAVAKDCSIMLAFSPDYDDNYPYIEINSKRISYRVSVTDLEPKTVNSLIKRKKTEREIVLAYQSHVEGKM